MASVQRVVLLLTLFLLILFPRGVTAAPVEGGFLAIDAHHDTRDRTMLTIRQLLIMPNRFSYFGLLNLFTPLSTSEHAE